MSGEVKHSAQVGLKNLVYAIMNDDETYNAVKSLSPAISAKVTPKVNQDTLNADDETAETSTVLSETDIELNTQDVPLAIQADLLGHRVDSNGVLIANSDDVAPYVAVGFKSMKGNGTYRYIWLLKGRFEEITEDYETKADKVKFSTPTLKATFITRKKDGNWIYKTDDDAGYTGGDNWFSKVYEPISDVTPLSVESMPTTGATGIAANSDIVFDFNKEMDSSTITTANIFLTKEDGNSIDSTIMLSSDKKTATLHPAASLTSGSYIAMLTKNVKSVSGVSLTSNFAVKFTVITDADPLTATTVPVDAATGVAASSGVVFTFSKTVDTSTINSSNLSLIKEDGTLIPTTLTVGTDNKTVTMKPNENLASGAYMAIASTGIKSSGGAALSTEIVVNFTV